MEFLNLIEQYRAEEASRERVFAREGTRVRGRRDPRYDAMFLEALELVDRVYHDPRRNAWRFEEAMTTSDFPLLFGDILDRQMLSAYQEITPSFAQYVKTTTVPDFRPVRRRTPVYGAKALLEPVPELVEYPETSLSEGSDITYSVAKYGKRAPFSWEAMINDDMDELKDIPNRFGTAARYSEAFYALKMFIGASGPNATFFSSANNNIITGNPDLDIDALQAALDQLATYTDDDGYPIVIDMVYLVVPQALELVARKILNATEIWEQTANDSRQMHYVNWMRNRFTLIVEPFIPSIATTANAKTSWFLFAGGSGAVRPAFEFAHLRGHETPEIWMKEPDSVRIGGGAANPMDGDFDTDAIQYKVRDVFGGAAIDPKMALASNGTNNP